MSCLLLLKDFTPFLRGIAQGQDRSPSSSHTTHSDLCLPLQLASNDTLEDKFKKLEGNDVDDELAQLKRGSLKSGSSSSSPRQSLPEGRPIRYSSSNQHVHNSEKFFTKLCNSISTISTQHPPSPPPPFSNQSFSPHCSLVECPDQPPRHSMVR